MKLKIMTHMVAFYPNKNESIKIAETLIKNGTDILEIQFPFSDPTADGKYIEMACTTALKSGFKVEKGFKIIETISSKYSKDIFIMSYANLLFFYGIETFITRTIKSGAAGLIIPDLPFDYDEDLYKLGKQNKIDIIPVIAPDTSINRLEKIMEKRPNFIYTTLRRGITGTLTVINDDVIQFLDNLNKNNIKVLGGFGIYSRPQIEKLSKYVYAAVVGSAFIKSILENNDAPPHKAVGEKLKELIY